MKFKRLSLILALVLAFSFVLTSCANSGGSATDAAPSSTAAPNGAADSSAPAPDSGGDKVLKIGVVVPLTGETAKAGIEHRDATVIAFEEIDYKIGDYTVELVWVDQTYDPEKGCLALEQAIVKDKIDVAFMNWNSSVSIALMDVVAKYKIPYYFGIGASGTIDDKWLSDPEKYSYYIGKGWARSEYMVEAYTAVCQQLMDEGKWSPANKTVAIYGDDTDWGRSFGSALITKFEEIGWSCVFEDYFTAQQTDMYAMLSKIKSTSPGVIAGTVSSPAAIAAFLKQAREVDVNGLIIADCLGENTSFYEMCGDASNYTLDNRPKFTTEAGLAFEKKFEEKNNYKPSGAAAGQVYDYARFLIQCCNAVLEEHGEITSENLYQYGKDVVMTGKTSFKDGVVNKEYIFEPGPFLPGPKVGEGFYIFPIVQYINGETITVWPDDSKEADLVVPDYAK